MLRLLIRGFIIANVFLAFFVCLGLLAFIIPSPIKRRPVVVKFNQRFCRVTLGLLGIKVKLAAPVAAAVSEGKNYLMVANHLSYLDVLAIASITPAVFVTSVEIRDTFFLGALCKLGMCEFVERRSIWHLPREIETLADRLRSGFSVSIFPESTTSNGEQLFKFKSSLLQTAPKAGVDVLPICLNYQEINGEPIDAQNRDLVFWYGKMYFLPHLVKLLTLKSLTVQVQILEEVSLAKFFHRKALTKVAYEQIAGHFVPVA